MADDRINPNALPFSPEKQKAVLGHVIYDERFFATVIIKVEAEWFADPIVCRIYEAVKKWYERWGRKPTVNELLESQWITKLDPKEILQVRGTVGNVKTVRETWSPDPLLAEMEIWLKARLIQLSLPRAAAAFNLQKIDESVTILNKMVKDYHDIHFMDDGEATFDDMRKEIIKENGERQHALTFGVSALDRLLNNNDGPGGSLLPGDMTVLLAPTNVGKTSCMVTVACHNILMGKSVLFITHEGRPDEIKNKFMRCLTGMSTPELLRAYLDPAKTELMTAFEGVFRQFLTFVPMNKPGLTVEEVASNIEKYHDKRRMATGSSYDLIVDDYPAKLTTKEASGGHFQPRHIQELVYNQFVQIALKHKAHVLVAIQTNREGSKVNRRQGQQKHESRLLHMEDVMEAWGPMTAAATVISLNRDSRDAELKKLTFLICKSRSSETGWAVVCNTDYDRCRTHADGLGAFWYRGEETLGEKSADIMNAFRNQAVPSEKIRYYETLGT